MLAEATINQRLDEMKTKNDPASPLWPEQCDGSRRALVIFVGPSPGGGKETQERTRKPNNGSPLWNKEYDDPVKEWSPGFRASFAPIVEAIFEKPYNDAAKLIARVNLDWLQNPEARDVPYYRMWAGCEHVLPVLKECNPELIIPMDEKTFGVFQIALYQHEYQIAPASIETVKIKISGTKRNARYHTNLSAFRASKGESSWIVIKSPQHPARVFDPEYAQRIGQAIRCAAEQIWNNQPIKIELGDAKPHP